MAAICAKETFAVGVVDVAFGRIARLQGPPEKGPESAPKLPFHCEREIALTARNSRSTRVADAFTPPQMRVPSAPFSQCLNAQRMIFCVFTLTLPRASARQT